MEKGKLNFYCRCKNCKGSGLGWINHTAGTWDRVHRSYLGGFVVDTTTGEILGCDDVSSIYADWYDCKRSLADCRSIDDFDQHLKFVDLRKLPPRNKAFLNTMQAEADWTWKNSNKTLDYRITVPMMNILSKLHDLVIYRNIIIMYQADLAKALGTSTSNLMKKLRPLIAANMVRVSTSKQGIRTGETKLTVNPRLIFRGDDAKRDMYIKQWYLDWTTRHPQSASSLNKRGWDDSAITTAALAA